MLPFGVLFRQICDGLEGRTSTLAFSREGAATKANVVRTKWLPFDLAVARIRIRN